MNHYPNNRSPQISQQGQISNAFSESRYTTATTNENISEIWLDNGYPLKSPERKPSTLYDKCILRNDCSPPLSTAKSQDDPRLSMEHLSPTECEEDIQSLGDSLKLIPRNRLCAYKVFRNSTFKFVGPGDQPLINNSNNSNKRTGVNGSTGTSSLDLYINKFNKTVMMKKITELARPFYDKRQTNVKEFKRIIPHPIIDDERFRPLLDAALSQEKEYSRSVSIKKIAADEKGIDKDDKVENSEVMFENIDEYEKMLIKKLEEIRQLKEKPKKQTVLINETKEKPPESIFAYHSNTGSVENVADQLQDQKIAVRRRRTQSYNIGQTQERRDEELSGSTQCNLKKIVSPKIIMSKQYNVINCIRDNGMVTKKIDFHAKGDQKMTDLTELNNEIEVCVDDQKMFAKIPRDDNVHVPLFFKDLSGKKIRFKIRYRGKMGQAFKAFFSRMNVTSVSEIVFTTAEGCSIAWSDTPYSLRLKANDVILVSNT